MGKNKIRDIKTIVREGSFRFEHVDPTQYNTIRMQWKREFGIVLPPREDLHKFGDPEDLRIVLAPITIRIYFRRRTTLEYQFDRGFITDLASVPKSFRSFVDNDDVKLVSAALIHDYNFSTHYLNPVGGRFASNKGFRLANKLFYGMIRKRGYSLGRSIIAYLAVNSIVGRAKYEKNVLRDPWTERTSRVRVLPRR